MKIFSRFLIMSSIALLPYAANAQQVSDPKTDQAGPARIQQQFEAPRFGSDVKPKVEVKGIGDIKAPEGAEKIKFKLVKLNISGASVYSSEKLEKFYTDKVGTTITLADLYGIATAITRSYRQDGYVLTQVIVPPQTIDNGSPKLKVVEGFIDNISVEGAADKGEEDLIRSYLAGIDKTKALQIKDLEQALLLINSVPGITARSFLTPSTTKVGAADLLVTTDHKAYEGSLGVNNYGTRYLGPLQMSSKMSFNSLLGYDEKITNQLVFSPSSSGDGYETAFVSMAYAQPLGSEGTMLTVLASNTNTKPGYTLEDFDVKGNSQNILLRVDQPIIRSRTYNFYTNFDFDYLNSDTKDNLGGDKVQDRVRAARIGIKADFLDNSLGASYNVFQATASKGFDIFNASDRQQDSTTRPYSVGNDFFKVEAEFLRQQRLTDDFSLLIGIKGQMSNGGLLSSEEFGFGGVNYGRGYDGSEIVGDEGFATKAEIQWKEPVKTDYVDSYNVYAFYDLGKTWNDDSSVSLAEQILTSAGLGVRASVNDNVDANAFVAFPINEAPEAIGDKNARFFAGLTRDF